MLACGFSLVFLPSRLRYVEAMRYTTVHSTLHFIMSSSEPTIVVAYSLRVVCTSPCCDCDIIVGKVRIRADPMADTICISPCSLYVRGICCRRVSVRLSVASRSSTKTAKSRITKTKPYVRYPRDCIVFLAKFERDHPQRGRQIEVG